MFSAILVVAAVAVSAPPSGGVRLSEQETYNTMLAAQARAAAELFTGAPCKDGVVSVLQITPVKIAEKPDMAAWREKVRVDGCGAATVQNLNVGRTGGSPPWRISHGLPGDSLAEINLQESALPPAVVRARSDLPASCAAIRIGDLYVAAKPGDVDLLRPGAPDPKVAEGRAVVPLPDEFVPDADKFDLTGSWMEVWPIKVCDNDRTMGVVFIPTKDHSHTAYMFLPIWQQVRDHGPDALPAPVAVNP